MVSIHQSVVAIVGIETVRFEILSNRFADLKAPMDAVERLGLRNPGSRKRTATLIAFSNRLFRVNINCTPPFDR